MKPDNGKTGVYENSSFLSGVYLTKLRATIEISHSLRGTFNTNMFLGQGSVEHLLNVFKGLKKAVLNEFLLHVKLYFEHIFEPVCFSNERFSRVRRLDRWIVQMYANLKCGHSIHFRRMCVHIDCCQIHKQEKPRCISNF